MPELPEVETIARGLNKRVTGDVVESVWLGQKKEPLKSRASEIVAALEQSRVASVRRMGKQIVFDLERDGAARARSAAQSSTRLRKTKNSSARSTQGAAQPETGEGADPTLAKTLWIVHLGLTGRLQVCEPQV